MKCSTRMPSPPPGSWISHSRRGTATLKIRRSARPCAASPTTVPKAILQNSFPEAIRSPSVNRWKTRLWPRAWSSGMSSASLHRAPSPTAPCSRKNAATISAPCFSPASAPESHFVSSQPESSAVRLFRGTGRSMCAMNWRVFCRGKPCSPPAQRRLRRLSPF